MAAQPIENTGLHVGRDDRDFLTLYGVVFEGDPVRACGLQTYPLLKFFLSEFTGVGADVIALFDGIEEEKTGSSRLAASRFPRKDGNGSFFKSAKGFIEGGDHRLNAVERSGIAGNDVGDVDDAMNGNFAGGVHHFHKLKGAAEIQYLVGVLAFFAVGLERVFVDGLAAVFAKALDQCIDHFFFFFFVVAKEDDGLEFFQPFPAGFDPVHIVAARGDGDDIAHTRFIERHTVDLAFGDDDGLTRDAEVHAKEDRATAPLLPFLGAAVGAVVLLRLAVLYVDERAVAVKREEYVAKAVGGNLECVERFPADATLFKIGFDLPCARFGFDRGKRPLFSRFEGLRAAHGFRGLHVKMFRQVVNASLRAAGSPMAEERAGVHV